MSKERKFPPLIISPSTLADKHQPLLTPDVTDASAAPAASPAASPGIRGIYSEYILNPTASSPVLPPLKNKPPASASFKKPPPLKPITSNYIYIDKNYKAVSDAAIDMNKSRLDYRRALEPKVQLPFETKPGETPRKIEVERKKRLFSTQNIQMLIDKEIQRIFGLKEISPYAQLLSYETFDDTEFEQRTLEEWLDLKPKEISDLLSEESVGDWVDKSAGKDIMFPKIPIPAVGLLRKARMPCLVTAYNSALDLWKVQWQKNSCWQLEYNSDITNQGHFDIDVSGNNDSHALNTDKNNKIVWMHRLNILFLAEDPFKFAKRYATALANREDAANCLVR